MTFRVGQKVVCIDGNIGGGCGLETFPIKGMVYTVRAVRWSDWHQSEQLRLVEIENEPRRYHDGVFECGFNSQRFRPVKTTSIEIFRAMLVNPPREVVDA